MELFFTIYLMKKFLVYFTIVAVLALGGWLLLKSVTGKSTYRSMYLIPSDAALIIESEDIINAWNSIVHSDAWYHLKNIESLQEINTDIQSVDSMISSNKILFKILGDRRITFSYHKTTHTKYDFLIIADVGKASRIKKLPQLLKNIMGDGMRVTSREYKGSDILEVYDKESGEMMYISFVHDKALFSYTYLLVEEALDEQEKLTLGRDLNFLDVYEKVSGNGLFNVYLPYKNFVPWLKQDFGFTTESVINQFNDFHYSGFVFDLNEQGLLSFEGYTSYNDTVPTGLQNYIDEGNTKLLSANIIPERVASVLKINFDDASEYLHNSLKNQGKKEYEDYKSMLAKTEKKLKIDIEENLLGWIEQEIVLLQTKPSNLGKANEFAIVLHGKNERDPRKNMDFIYHQIEKNSPVKIKHANYKEFDIAFVSFPGLLKALFGRMLDKIEKPYFTQIENNIVISNHPQTLKNIIDSYIENKTLGDTEDYDKFSKNFESKAGMPSYFDVPVLFKNLKEYFDTETWTSISKNEQYITSFSNAGLYIDNASDLLHFTFKAQYKRNFEAFIIENYKMDDIFQTMEFAMDWIDNNKDSVNDDTPQIEPSEIILVDLDESKHEQFYEDGELLLTVQLKDGKKHGTFKEYYPNGELKIKGKFKNDLPGGQWKYFDENGNLAREIEYEDGIAISDE